MSRIPALRIASEWALKRAYSEWQPPIPDWARPAVLAFANTGEDFYAAKVSVNVLLPKLVKLLSSTMGDRYHLSASESRGQVFYFITSRHQLDAFSIMLSVPQEGTARIVASYVPYDLRKMPKLKEKVEVVHTAEPDLAGMALMRAGRQLLTEIKRRNLIAARA
jgi:hypothetical protein